MKFKRLTAPVAAAMLKQLVMGGTTYTQLECVTGVGRQSIALWVNAMRDQKLLHVSDWQADVRGYPTIAAFRWAPGASDVPRPSIPAAVRAKVLRLKRKVVANA